MFNIYELCPLNAPKQCEWCKGPYHIRKRCPKLASLVNENEKKKRENVNNIKDEYHSTSTSSRQRTFQYDRRVQPIESVESFNYYGKEQTNDLCRFHPNNYGAKQYFQYQEFDYLQAKCPPMKKNNSSQRQKSSHQRS